MVSIPELIFFIDIVRFIIACWGALYSGMELHDCVKDRLLVEKSGRNGAFMTTAQSNVTAERIRFVMHLLFAVLAASSIVWPIINDAHHHPWPRRLVTDRLMLIALTMMLTTKSWLARLARHEVMETLQHRRFTDNSHRRRETDL